MPPPTRRLEPAVAAALVAAALLVYAPVRDFGFVNYDDPHYVSENPHVTAGLRWSGVVWAATASHAANWHPLTCVSHMLDVQAFGMWAGGHHLVNVGLHAANAALLFAVLARTTRAPWRSAFVAGVFALHPLRVESVAWISERKDVLSGLGWMLALLAYMHYVGRPGVRRYLLVVTTFAAALLAKPMVVTLPVVLLLLDWWPLGRPWDRRLVWEKLPLLALSAAASAVAVVVQRAAGAMESVAALPLGSRVANAIVAYAWYVRATIWPSGLAVFYPLRPIAPASLATALASLAALSALAIAGRRRPALLVGWLWFLGTLVPVIGLVKVGAQARADRFTYLPQIGLLLMIAWGLPDLLARLRLRAVTPVAAAVALTACAATTTRLLPVWRDSIALFTHTLAVSPDNPLGEGNLGSALVEAGRAADAIPHLERAIALAPGNAGTRVTLGRARADVGDTDGARAAYTEALVIDPRNAMAHYDVGVLAMQEGQPGKAVDEFHAALRLAPDYVHARHRLADTLASTGRLEEAVAEYRTLLTLAPDLPSAHGNFAIALEHLGRTAEAIAEYRTVVQLAPSDPIARFNLAATLIGIGADTEGLAQLEEAVRLRPDWPEARAAIAEVEARRDRRSAGQP